MSNPIEKVQNLFIFNTFVKSNHSRFILQISIISCILAKITLMSNTPYLADPGRYASMR